MRTLGVERGLCISEYGIFRVPRGIATGVSDKDAGVRIGVAKEADLYHVVKLDYVPPKLREDRGEIQAAREDKMPDLIEVATFAICTCTVSGPTAGIRLKSGRAPAKNWDINIAASPDHSPAVRFAGGLSAKKFIEQGKEIEKLRRTLRGIKLLAGFYPTAHSIFLMTSTSSPPFIQEWI